MVDILVTVGTILFVAGVLGIVSLLGRIFLELKRPEED